MHPAAVMLAITAGASVAGILGMLLAVPLTAAATGCWGAAEPVRVGDGRPEAPEAPDAPHGPGA